MKKIVFYFAVLAFIILLIVINITYHKPEYFQKSVPFCSIDGDTVDVQVDIQWHKYFFRGTELHGKLIFGETEYLATRDKYKPKSLSDTSLFKKISDKINGRRDELYFYNSEQQYPFPDQLMGIFYSQTNVYCLYSTLANQKSNPLKTIIYYGPAATKEEAHKIASDHFGLPQD